MTGISLPTRTPASAPVPPVTAIQPVLDVRDFSFWYGKKRALNDVTMTVAPRRITALIGPSGCGKSTMLRSINRMNDLVRAADWDGDILFQGRSIYAPAQDVVALRRTIGMVFQHPNPFPKSVFDNVAYGPVRNRLCRKRDLPERVERALRRAALWDEVKDRMDEAGTALSGGQQQRLCMARTLANDPEILLLDEPTSALDPIATQRIEELLVELKDEVTVVIVTHNLHQAARIADYTAFFYLGELIEYDRSETLFTHPRHERTEAYLTGRFG